MTCSCLEVTHTTSSHKSFIRNSHMAPPNQKEARKFNIIWLAKGEREILDKDINDNHKRDYKTIPASLSFEQQCGHVCEPSPNTFIPREEPSHQCSWWHRALTPHPCSPRTQPLLHAAPSSAKGSVTTALLNSLLPREDSTASESVVGAPVQLLYSMAT